MGQVVSPIREVFRLCRIWGETTSDPNSQVEQAEIVEAKHPLSQPRKGQEDEVVANLNKALDEDDGQDKARNSSSLGHLSILALSNEKKSNSIQGAQKVDRSRSVVFVIEE